MKSVVLMMVASLYSVADNNGTQTASGKKLDDRVATCAHKTMRFGANLRLRFGKHKARCVITDRGPYVAGRELDVSVAVAEALGPEFINRGVATVEVTR